ncbi:MAG: hypothetical protein QXR15_01925, partial [Candidatus Hadarchaeales archaeon]
AERPISQRNGHSFTQIGHIPLVGLTSLTLVLVPVVDCAFKYDEFFITRSVMVICLRFYILYISFLVKKYKLIFKFLHYVKI